MDQNYQLIAGVDVHLLPDLRRYDDLTSLTDVDGAEEVIRTGFDGFCQNIHLFQTNHTQPDYSLIRKGCQDRMSSLLRSDARCADGCRPVRRIHLFAEILELAGTPFLPTNVYKRGRFVRRLRLEQVQLVQNRTSSTDSSADRASDANLIAAFRKGDESAFEVLYGRHYPTVLNVAYRMLGDRDAAEDLAQDVFVKLYTSPGSYRPTAKLSTWLYRVTHNAFIDELRKRKNRPVELVPDIHSPGASEQSDLADAVQTALASLPEKQRAAVVLQRYEGLSYQEIAEVLGTSVPAVESLLFRARESLKAVLSKYLE